jgi:uridylate kinase
MDTIILSLGGSILIPDKPDYFFLREFKNFVINNLDMYKFIIVCGGGKTNSYYNDAAKRVSNISSENLDWIGIMASRLNAEYVRSVFGDLAHDKVLIDPTRKISTRKKILIGAGWIPGRSSDYVAVLLAKTYNSISVLNLTKLSHVYDKDPLKYKSAKKLFSLTWKEYIKIVGTKWSPRLNSPFDPIASIFAKDNKMKVAILKGTELVNVQNYLENKNFEGTIISG